MRQLIIISTTLALLAASSASRADDRAPEALERLQRGEVLVERIRSTESGGSVRVKALMQLDARTLWDYIASCDHVFAYVDGMQACALLAVRQEPGADISTVRQVIDKGWLVPEMEYTMEVRREPYSKVEFSLLEGNLERMQGLWLFEPLADDLGLLVTHEIHVQPSFPVPRWLIRRNMRKGIPDMLACLRGLTNGSQPGRHEDDLDRCPHR